MKQQPKINKIGKSRLYQGFVAEPKGASSFKPRSRLNAPKFKNKYKQQENSNPSAEIIFKITIALFEIRRRCAILE